MGALVLLLALLLLAVVLAVITAPLRASRREPEDTPERAELETAREAKYREIRDTELDFRTGKLSAEDFAATDGSLRAEALEILDRLQALEAEARPRDA